MPDPGEPLPSAALASDGAQFASIADVLRADRAATLARLDVMAGEYAELVAASADANLDDEHDPEGTTVAFERAQIATLVEQVRSRLEDLDQALDRAAGGHYGVCATCSGPISPERLLARPAARTCIECARAGR